LLARQEERQDTWRLARRHLPDTQFQAIWLRYAEEMNIPQVARAMGKTQIAVRVILFRARQTLASKLDRAGAEAMQKPPALSPLAHGGNS